MFIFSNFGSSMKIYVFDRLFDPTYLNLKKDDEDAWKVYAERVRTIMAKCLKVPKVEQGYRDAVELQKIYKAVQKKILNRRNGKKKTD